MTESPSKTARRLGNHIYPQFLDRWPPLVRLLHATNQAGILRNWYVRRRLRAVLDSLPMNPDFVDVGCGAGDHLFYSLRRRRDGQAVGIDRSEECVTLCRGYANRAGAKAVFIRADLDDLPGLPAADLLLCVTMLQYVANDAHLLRKLRLALREGGRLLLYVPVRNERLSSLSRRIVDENPHHYDAVQRRRKVYQVDDILESMEASGFRIDHLEQAYGLFGKLQFEASEYILYALSRKGWRFLALPAAVALLPALTLLMMLDFALPVRRGNGLLIVAR